MVVYRADPIDLKEMDVDVTKKSGKDLGIGFAECKGYGIYITEIVIIYFLLSILFFLLTFHDTGTRWNYRYRSSYDQR